MCHIYHTECNTVIRGVEVAEKRGARGQYAPPKGQTRCRHTGGSGARLTAQHTPCMACGPGGNRWHPISTERGSGGALDAAPSAGGMSPAASGPTCLLIRPSLTPWNPGKQPRTAEERRLAASMARSLPPPPHRGALPQTRGAGVGPLPGPPSP